MMAELLNGHHYGYMTINKTSAAAESEVANQAHPSNRSDSTRRIHLEEGKP
jgi:hypothetical protein